MMFEIIRQYTINKWSAKSPKTKFGLFSRLGSQSTLEGYNSIGKFSFYKGMMGKYSYVGDNVIFMGAIGRFSSISSNVHIINGRHPLKAPYVSTSPVLYALHTPVGCTFVDEQSFDEYVFADTDHKYPVVIGNDCWIGYGVSIIEGVSIGDGAVVLANATVTKDVSPYAIVGGVPAKVVGYRYDEETIQQLLSVKWWGREDDWIKDHAHLFSNLDEFLKLTK